MCTRLEFYATQISRLLQTFRANLSDLQAMGITYNLDESLPNHLVAYSVQIMQMRKSPHE